MNIGSIFENEFKFLHKMSLRTNLQDTHFCSNLLKVINKTAPSSNIARDAVYETNISESKLKKRYMKLCA